MKKDKNKWFNPCNVYILIWLLDYVSSMFLTNNLISILCYIPFLLMTLYFSAKAMVSYNNRGAITAYSVFFFVLMIYGMFLWIMDDVPGQDRKSFLMMVFGSLGPVFPFFVFTKEGLLTEERMRGWFWVFFIVCILSYFINQRNELALAMESGYKYEEITNNNSYLFVGLLPFVFLIRKKVIVQYLVLAVMLYFVFSGMKRGAMLTGSLVLLWFVYDSLRTSSKSKKWGVLLLTAIVLIIGYQYIVYYLENSDYFQLRVEQTMSGQSSNRDTIYTKLWNHIKTNNNLFQILFGEGASHTEIVTGGMKAHNDWLELLIDCGFLTTFIYFIYWMVFLIDWRRSKSNRLVYALGGACFIFLFAKSLFSMSFGKLPFYTSMLIGYCFAYYSTNNKPEFLDLQQ